MAVDTDHLQRCPAGLVGLSDVILKTQDVTFPAHSQILALHSAFIAELLSHTGNFCVQEPVVIQSALQPHGPETVRAWLLGIYGNGTLQLDSAQMAWQLCLLVDQFDCAHMLQQCEAFASKSMEAAGPATTEEALRWIDLADRLNFKDLKAMCAKRIASDFDRVQRHPQFCKLPANALQLIMTELSVLLKSQQELIGQMKALLSTTRTGLALMHVQHDRYNSRNKQVTYSFFCEEADCSGHVMVKRIVFAEEGFFVEADASGTYHCKKAKWSKTIHHLDDRDIRSNLLLPADLVSLLAMGRHEVVGYLDLQV